MTGFKLTVKKLMEENIPTSESSFLQEKLTKQEKYIIILDKGDKEYQVAINGKKKIRFFNEELCSLKQLRLHKNEHLIFLADF